MNLHWLRIKADTTRLSGAFSWPALIFGFLFRRSFRAIITLRLCNLIYQSPAPVRWMMPLAKLLHRLACQRAGMDLPWRTNIGAGLSIAHGWGLVVNEEVVIGMNVTLFHGVTLGRSDTIAIDGSRESRFPVIESDVWIGPHAIVVGSAVVGTGSRISGGAFVNREIPPRSIVMGNPATIVKTGCPTDVFNPANVDQPPAA